jgi:hypothetical protein
MPAKRSAGYVVREMRHGERFCKCEFGIRHALRQITPRKVAPEAGDAHAAASDFT